jgi:18S rRNA (guanine1575-N7)-methyltransferase
MITNAAMKNGFTGGLIVDYPNSKKAKKYYLFLMAGYSEEIMNEARSVIMPKAKTGDSEDEDNEASDSDSDDERITMKGKQKKYNGIKKQDKFNGKHDKTKGGKAWIMKKKDR